jgi:hypothetical protein
MAAIRVVSKARGSILTVEERWNLHAQTRFDLRTILRWERGDKLMNATKRALDQAAWRMHLPVPVPGVPHAQPR